jgi:hypothetical protein
MMLSVLNKTNTLGYIFIVLGDWNNNPLVNMSLHQHTKFWFQSKQSFSYILMLRAEINFIVASLTRLELNPQILTR